MRQGEITTIVRKYADTLKESGVVFDAVYMFGSQAKGSAHASSDIDVAVVSPRLRKRYDEGRLLLRKLRRNIDLRIEPHGFTPEDWQDDLSPLVHEIKTSGVKVA